jgi:hypothetical protein
MRVGRHGQVGAEAKHGGLSQGFPLRDSRSPSRARPCHAGLRPPATTAALLPLAPVYSCSSAVIWLPGVRVFAQPAAAALTSGPVFGL